MTEKAGGTNMSVDVAADEDVALVDGGDDDNQGRYVVAPHTSTVNLASVTSNTSGNPRLDYVVLHVRDDTHDSSGEFDARVRYLTGTATSGATHDNPVGAPAIPDTAILLAQVLVPTGTTSAITNSMIRDRRPRATGACEIVVVTAGDYTLTAATATLLDGSRLAARLELSGLPLLVELVGQVEFNVTNGNGIIFHTYIDGAAPSPTCPTFNGSSSVGVPVGGVLHREIVDAPAAGSHLVDIHYSVNSGITATLRANSTRALQLPIQELPDGIANG